MLHRKSHGGEAQYIHLTSTEQTKNNSIINMLIF